MCALSSISPDEAPVNGRLKVSLVGVMRSEKGCVAKPVPDESGHCSELGRQLQSQAAAERVSSNASCTDSGVDDFLKFALDKRGLPYVDKRAKGGALWIIGGPELKQTIADFECCGVHFRYKEKGGKASKHLPAWFTKDTLSWSELRSYFDL